MSLMGREVTDENMFQLAYRLIDWDGRIQPKGDRHIKFILFR